MRRICLLGCFLFGLGQLVHAQIGRLPLSPLQKVNQNIAKTDIVIEYSRPSIKGRRIFGSLVPYEEYWRTGANRNTTIWFSQDVIIDKQRIKKGKYAVITKPGKEEWQFLLYQDIDNWDVPETIDEEKIVCYTEVKPEMLTETIESLNIYIGDFTNYNFELNIQWENSRIKIPVALTTKETMASLIDDELLGPTASDYYLAAVYQLESEKNYKTGLNWINEAITIRNEPVWYDYRVKALLLMESNDRSELEETIRIGNEMATAINNTYGISEFKRIKGLIEK